MFLLLVVSSIGFIIKIKMLGFSDNIRDPLCILAHQAQSNASQETTGYHVYVTDPLHYSFHVKKSSGVDLSPLICEDGMLLGFLFTFLFMVIKSISMPIAWAFSKVCLKVHWVNFNQTWHKASLYRLRGFKLVQLNDYIPFSKEKKGDV